MMQRLKNGIKMQKTLSKIVQKKILKFCKKSTKRVQK